MANYVNGKINNIGELSESLEDYLEVIYNISSNEKSVYVSDIANKKSVKMPSVHKAVKKLMQMGLVDHVSYDSISLTQSGGKLAKKITTRHNLIKKFFTKTLGLDEKTAESDACKIEHYLHSKTVSLLTNFVKKNYEK